jgi:hypothetical protein
MSEGDQGWGSPSTDVVAGELYDWGWGSPPPAAWTDTADTGWGSPSYGDSLPVFVASLAVLPDDGGEIVKLTSSWLTLGPYRVALLDSFTGLRWPDAAVQTACSAPLRFDRFGKVTTRTVDERFDCYVEPRAIVPTGSPSPQASPQAYLAFTLPTLPTGLYDIELSWGPHLAVVVTLPAALRIVYRGRSRIVWGARSTFPAYYAAGPRSARLEDRLGVPE